MLLLADGPEMTTITGPNEAQTGDIVTLSCDSLSNPPSNYTWFFNGSSVANGSDLVTPPLTVDMSGMYTCIAYNNITGNESLASTMLTVHGEGSTLDDVQYYVATAKDQYFQFVSSYSIQSLCFNYERIANN